MYFSLYMAEAYPNVGSLAFAFIAISDCVTALFC